MLLVSVGSLWRNSGSDETSRSHLFELHLIQETFWRKFFFRLSNQDVILLFSLVAGTCDFFQEMIISFLQTLSLAILLSVWIGVHG